MRSEISEVKSVISGISRFEGIKRTLFDPFFPKYGKHRLWPFCSKRVKSTYNDVLKTRFRVFAFFGHSGYLGDLVILGRSRNDLKMDPFWSFVRTPPQTCVLHVMFCVIF